jgi:hypothetical protein
VHAHASLERQTADLVHRNFNPFIDSTPANMSADNSSGDRNIYIANLRPHDVLSGRGAFTDRYFGNLWFRTLIRDRKDRHASAQQIDEKNQIVHEIYQEVCQAGGRFLRKVATADEFAVQQGETKDIWQPISKDKALEKIKQAFRDLSEAKTKRRASANLSRVAALSTANLDQRTESDNGKPPAKPRPTKRRASNAVRDPIIGMNVTGEPLSLNNEDSISRQHVEQLQLCRQVIARYQALQQEQPPPDSIQPQHCEPQRFEATMCDQNKRATSTPRNSLSQMLQQNQAHVPMTPSTEQFSVAPTFAQSNGWNSSYLDTLPSAQQIALSRVAQQSNILNSASFDMASLLLPARNPNSSQAPSVNDAAFPLSSPQGTANGSSLDPQGTANGNVPGPSAGWSDRRQSLSTLALPPAPAPAQPSSSLLPLPLVVDERNWRLLLEAFPAQLALIQANVAPPFTSRDLSTLLDIGRFALLDTSTTGATALRQLHHVLSTVASLPSQQLELSILDWESLVLVSRSVLGSLPPAP